MRHTGKIYARLSRDEEGQRSIDDQIHQCRLLLHRHGVADEDVTVFYEEPGSSGFKDIPLPERDRFIAHPADIAATWMLDRISRRGTEDTGRITRLFEEAGTRYVTVADGIDTSLDSSEINVAIRAVMAKEYSKGISKNVKRGKASGAAAGRWQGGPQWYGYMVDADGKWRGPKTVDPAQSKVLHEIRDRYVAGERFLTIARDLNDRKIPTVNGTHWRAENMLRLISNRRYVGILQQNGVEYPGSWPAIFTPQQSQDLVLASHHADRTRHWPTGPTGFRTYLLTKYLVCSVCGGSLRGAGKVRRGKFRRLYRCHVCYKTQRAADPLELLVSRTVRFLLANDHFAQLLGTASDGSDLHNLLAEQASIRLRLDELHTDYYSPSDLRITREHFIRQKTALESALQSTEANLSKEMRAHTAIRLDVGQTLQEWWDRGSMDQKRQLIGLLIEKIVVKPSNTGGRKAEVMWNGYRFKPQDVEIHFVEMKDLTSATSPTKITDQAILAAAANILGS